MRAFVVAAGLSLATASAARAGNYDTIPMGDLGAVAAGAVVATGNDCGSVAYNPAGLVGIERDSVSISASLFEVRASQIPGYLSTTTPDGTVTAPASRIAFQTVPPAVIFGRKLRPDLAYAFSLTVPEARAIDTERRNDLMDASGLQLRESLRIISSSMIYRGGATIAWAPMRRLRLGATLFAALVRVSNLMAFQLSLLDAGGGRTYVSYESSQRNTVGALGGLIGLQWSVSSRFGLGVSVEPTLLGLFGSSSQETSELSSRTANGQQPIVMESHTTTPMDAAGQTFGVLVARGGVAYIVDRGWISAQIDYRPTRSVTNARLGAIRELSPTLRVGAGLFTDFDRATPARDIMFDFIGGTAGILWGKRLALAASASPLILTTTFAARYAYGWGDAQALRVDPTAPDIMQLATVAATPGTMHEMSLYIGSGVSY